MIVTWLLKMGVAVLQIVDAIVCIATLTMLRPSLSIDMRLLLIQHQARRYE